MYVYKKIKTKKHGTYIKWKKKILKNCTWNYVIDDLKEYILFYMENN